MSPDLIDIVVPCYNEAANIPELVGRIEAALRNVQNLEYEILIVDDGSSDSTPSVVTNARLSNPKVGFIRLLRNFGHQAALSAGLEYARGDAVVVMDADLQHPPELLPEMIKQWRLGFDVVQTVRTVQPGALKSFSSRTFYRLLNYVSEIRIRDGAADFRLMSRRAVDGLLALPERTRFLRGLITWLGFPAITIAFEAPPRRSGQSSYSFRKMANLATDALVTLSSSSGLRYTAAMWLSSLPVERNWSEAGHRQFSSSLFLVRPIFFAPAFWACIYALFWWKCGGDLPI
jgi:glycosyltransferase involved in cell wall biosynthesis